VPVPKSLVGVGNEDSPHAGNESPLHACLRSKPKTGLHAVIWARRSESYTYLLHKCASPGKVSD
jgi:hypothetical protein